MKKIRQAVIFILCMSLMLGTVLIKAADLPNAGINQPGGIPAPNREYILSLSITDAETGEEINYEHGRPYAWYVPVCMGYVPNDATNQVIIRYITGEWDLEANNWVNVSDEQEMAADVEELGFTYINIPLENAVQYMIMICKPLSTNNYLSSLEVERGTLVPEFTSENTEYTLQVDEEVDEMTIHAKAQSEKAKVMEETITPLSKGENYITITVKAEDESKRYYHILITRGNPEDESKEDEEEDKKQESSSGGSDSGRYNTERDLSNFSKVKHVATKVSNTGTMIANSGLTVEQAVASLSAEQKEQILTRLKQKIPYTSLGYTITANEMKTATQSLFTDEQITKLLASPELIAQLGINLNELVTTVNLQNMSGSMYNDINETGTAKTAIEEAASMGVLEPAEDGKFNPDSSIKFEDAVKYLDRLLLLNHMETMKLGRSTVEMYFKDISMTDYPYIGSVASKLQVKTTRNLASKQLGQNLTRQEMAQMIYELTEGKLETNSEEIHIADIGDNTYEPALNYAVKSGVMALDNDCILPAQNLTKAETVQVLMKLNKAIKNMQELEAKAKVEEANVIANAAEDPLVKKESNEE